MLINLQIFNYILIEELNIDWKSNFNVLTGETGAGKSILLGALALLSGKKADFKTLLDPNKKCTIEGTFISPKNVKPLLKQHDLEFYDEVIIRREIHPNSRSRAFVNDSPVTNEILKQLSSLLVDIHSQHESSQLAQQDYQLKLLDSFAGTIKLNDNLEKKYIENQTLLNKIKRLEADSKQKQKDNDYNQFLLDELVTLDIKENEQQNLEHELSLLQNASRIKQNIEDIIHGLGENENSIINQLREILQNSSNLSRINDTYIEYHNRLDSTIIELDDISQSLKTNIENVDEDPEKLEKLQDRVNQIYQLQKKHNVNTGNELMTIKDKLSALLFSNETLENEILNFKTKYEEEVNSLSITAKKLSIQRKKAIPSLEKDMIVICQSLGMPYAQIRIESEEIPLSKNGTENINILFSANKGINPQVIEKKASGGEVSRLVFAIKVILARKNQLPTLIFDEIDTGVSGEVAHQMGEYMSSIGSTSQIVAISHLPQIASKASNHYFVFKNYDKNNTTSHIKMLDKKERVDELAKMIGGDTPSEIAIQNAREMLYNNLNKK